MTMDRARLALHLMERYTALLPSLKALGAYRRGERVLTPEDVEAHRKVVTPWFSNLWVLLQHGLIDVELFRSVAGPAEAQQWVEHVASLDAAIRKVRSGEDEAPSHPIEDFWRAYAKGRLVIPRRRWQTRFALWLLTR